MKALCITGTDDETLTRIGSAFTKAGMGAANPITRETVIDINRWHQQVPPKPPIGQLWQSLAVDLVLANLEQELWGWADSRSADFLDFWAGLEPNIYFLLVCIRPEQRLSSVAKSDDETLTVKVLEEWYDHHKKLLDFYLNHPDRCILVDSDEAITHIVGQLNIAHQQWKLPLRAMNAEVDPESSETISTDYPSHSNNETGLDYLAGFVARELLVDTKKDVVGLFQEISAAQYPLSEEESLSSSTLLDWFNSDVSLLDRLLVDFQALQRSSSQKDHFNYLALEHSESLEDAEEQIKQLKLENEQSLSRSKIEVEKYTKVNADLEKQLDFQKLKLSGTQKDLQKVEQEKDLLTLQLNQVQEELEFIYQENQNSKVSAIELSKKVDDLEGANCQEKKIVEKVKEDLGKANQEKARLTLQLEQFQEELEVALIQAQEADSCDKVGSTDKELNLVKEELIKADQEKELITLQLHQVQEELEYYFQAFKEKEEELDVQLEKFRKLQAGNIGVYSSSVDFEIADKASIIKWRFNDLELIDKVVKEIRLTTTLKFGRINIEFDESQDVIEGLEKLGTLNSRSGQLARLSKLSVSDYMAVIAAIKTVGVSLERNQISLPNINKWKKAYKIYLDALNELPPRLLYSKAILRSEQSNPDYEHLWITLRSAQFGSASAESWSFRLSCAGVTADRFGDQPKLEFPHEDNQILDSWRPDLVDDYGDKYELRFAKPNSLDMNVWKRLSSSDQLLVSSLINQLPSILRELEESGRYIPRDWSQWIAMAEDMLKIVQSKSK